MTTTVDRSELRVSRLERDTDGAWRRAVDDLAQATLAHAPEWFAVIRHAYGHDPLYLIAEDDDGDRGVLPAFIVRRGVLGTVVASVPFLDGGGPCATSAAAAVKLTERLIEEARHARATVVDLRCAHPLDISTPPSEHKVKLTLALPSKADRLWQQLDGKVRNQIRKAERAGLSIEVGGSEHLAPFYEVFAARMRDLGSPVHSRWFLQAVVEAFGDHARVVLVRKERVTVGGLVALTFKDSLAVPWATCRKDYLTLCPNMLLYWETLRSACEQGFRRFDFGRSTRGSGTYHFKRQWGARDEPLYWYTIPLTRSRAPVDHAGRSARFLVRAWRRLPLSATRYLGPRVRKYLIQ